LADGVYKGYVCFDGIKKDAIMNWGSRPTVDNKRIIEAFIFDFEGDLYGKEVEIGFNKFVRKQMKFSSVQELKEVFAHAFNQYNFTGSNPRFLQ
jgi:riboflavin kinase/FMN adenylyltransferase